MSRVLRIDARTLSNRASPFSAAPGGGPVKAVDLESFSSILHLVQGPNVVELTAAAAQRWASIQPESVAAVNGCSVNYVDTTGGVHGAGALVSHSHNFA